MRKAPIVPAFILLSSAHLLTPFAHAWGNQGHRIINHLAAANLPKDVPFFLRSQAAISEIEYLGPDRTVGARSPSLNSTLRRAPEHFIDLELADALGPLPHRRLDFEAAAFAAGQRPEKIGLQPWEATEVWERLKAALREYRQLSAAHKSTRDVEQAAIFYAGWLGHYVGDASQPLHTTIQYNGWTGPNPNGYTTAHTIHWQFEGPFVDANLHASDVQPYRLPCTRLRATFSTITWRIFANHRNMWRRSTSWRKLAVSWEKGRRSRATSPRIALPPEPACFAT